MNSFHGSKTKEMMIINNRREKTPVHYLKKLILNTKQQIKDIKLFKTKIHWKDFQIHKPP